MKKLFDDEVIDRRFHRGQWRMLGMTIIGYTLFYFLRKNFSFAMPGLEQDLGVSKSMLGNCLFAGGIVYGISKFLNGFIGDRVNARKMLCFGLAVCVCVNIAFGFAAEIAGLFLGEGADAASRVATLAVVIGGLYVLSQFFQGTGFPPCAKLLAFWIPPNELATKMNLWNTSHSIGGGIVAKICGVIMGLGVIGSANQGIGMWKWCFWSMAALGFAGLVLLWFGLPGTPEEEGLPPVPGTETLKTESQTTMIKGDRPSVWKGVFSHPAIWVLGCCNFTINAVRALVADWGPTMLQEAKHLTSSEAGTVIMAFEFAGIAGMLLSGWVTDRFAGGRSPRVCVFLMALTALFLWLFLKLPTGAASGAALCAVGFCLYGPQALTGVAATNLCGKQFAGTSIGFISLFSYIGVSISGKVCGTLAQSTGGWQMPVTVIASTAVAGMVFFLLLWGAKADNYGE